MILVPLPRESALTLAWPASEPVPVLERPVRKTSSASVTGHDELRAVLDAIPNTGGLELGYDEWFRVLAAVHHETQGSDEGLQLAHDFSAKAAGKYDPGFLDERVWPFIRSEGRDAVVGLGTLHRIAGAHGWHEPLDEDMFDDVSAQDDRPPAPGRLASLLFGDDGDVRVLGASPLPDLTSNTARAATVLASSVLVTKVTRESGNTAPPPPTALPAVRRRGIPAAHHLTTDQANANRLVNAFGRRVFVAASRWHVWDGKRWVADEADVYRYGCQLSELIRGEAQAIKARASVLADMAAIKKANEQAEALQKWALRSEMKGTIEAAIGLARKMLTIDADMLDRDPWALNCANGTVDLRTGALRAHNPEDLITRLVPVDYEVGALCPTWERVLGEITLGDVSLSGYLQRWFGYCLTALVTEQVFAVHWGGGSNGKSTVLGLMAETLGDYASTAPPGLMAASKGDRHPTEIAALMGRRQVTAHESGEGVVLREDFIKQATGDDRLEARFMRGDFFGFAPTHKLQLLTNHKPAIKGQDLGIWRRVQLVPYLAAFGSVAQVLAGTHTHVRDMDVVSRLRAELPGILAWRVRGAMEWATGGLAAPQVVLSASAAYKAEQDRVGQFVAECCERGPVEGPNAFAEPLTEGMGGLYPAYVSWCKESGVFALSKARFTDDVLRVAGVGATTVRLSPVENGRRRKLTLIPGIRLLPE